MGDGSRSTRTSAGTPYKAAYGNTSFPHRGHVYTTSSSKEQDDKYTATVMPDWALHHSAAQDRRRRFCLNGLVREAQIAVGERRLVQYSNT